jgi:hypothetical protein
MDLYDVVVGLNGKICPIGETNEDEKRFKNLVSLTELVDRLLNDIVDVANQKHRVEASIKKSGEFADKFLKEAREE